MKQIAVLVLAFLVGAGVNAQERYVAVNDALLTSESGEEVAKLKISVPVTVVEEQDGKALVQVDGAIAIDGDSPLPPFFTNSVDQIEVAAELDTDRLVIEEEVDGWANVSLEGWIALTDLTEDRGEIFSRASSHYQRYCSRCHVGYAGPVEALVQRLQPREWPEVAHRMAVGTGISNADLDLVVQWLQHESQQHQQ